MAELAKRSSAHSSIMRIKALVDVYGYAPDGFEVDRQLSKLTEKQALFLENHLALVGAAEGEDAVAVHDALLASIEETCDKLIVKLQRLRPKSDSVSMIGRAPVNSLHDTRLDPVKLPVFDGRRENWLVFKDMFEFLVHNRPELDSMHKMNRLRQCVKEDAVPMMGGAYTGDYELLWEELKRRYDKPRRLVEAHVFRVLELPDYPVETKRCIQDVIDVVRGSLRALKVMKLPTEQWDGLMYPIVIKKLPHEAWAHWCTNNKGDGLPVLMDLLEELETYSDTLREPGNVWQRLSGLQPHQNDNRRRMKSYLVAPPSKRERKSDELCLLCKRDHRLGKCPQFAAMALTERWRIVRRNRLCFKCLCQTHMVSECDVEACKVCLEHHDSLLCRGLGPAASGTLPVALLRDPGSAKGSSNTESTPRIFPRN